MSEPVENVDVHAWIRCPNCGNEDIELQHWGAYDDYRARVHCPECGSGGFFD